jgi:PAS domain-containing protein
MALHQGVALAVRAIEQEIERSLESLPCASEAARALDLARDGLRLLRCALEDQSADHDRALASLRALGAAREGPLVETDVAGIVWRANSAAGELLRSAPRAIVRSPLAAFIPESEREAYYRALAHLRSSALHAPAHGRPVTVGWLLRPKP